jgi:hypothetical protein
LNKIVLKKNQLNNYTKHTNRIKSGTNYFYLFKPTQLDLIEMTQLRINTNPNFLFKFFLKIKNSNLKLFIPGLEYTNKILSCIKLKSKNLCTDTYLITNLNKKRGVLGQSLNFSMPKLLELGNKIPFYYINHNLVSKDIYTRLLPNLSYWSMNYTLNNLNPTKSYKANFILTAFPNSNMFNWSKLAFIDLLNNNVYRNFVKLPVSGIRSHSIVLQKINLIKFFLLRYFTKQRMYYKSRVTNLFNTLLTKTLNQVY